MTTVVRQLIFDLRRVENEVWKRGTTSEARFKYVEGERWSGEADQHQVEVTKGAAEPVLDETAQQVQT